MDEKTRFVTLAQTDRFTISSLGEQFGINRKTGTPGSGASGAERDATS